MTVPRSASVVRALAAPLGAIVAERSRLYLACELGLLFVLTPLCLYFVRHDLGQIIIPTLLVVGLVCTVLLLADPTFDRRRLYTLEGFRPGLRRIVIVFVPFAVLVAVAVVVYDPERLLWLPKNKPVLWLMIMTGYPLFSVYPQELIFRTFFFHRYRRLFPRPAAMIAASGVSFGLAHIFFGNWIAPVATLAGGLLFARTYARTRSTPLACVEHGLWGDYFFTLGLGYYFYGGSIPP